MSLHGTFELYELDPAITDVLLEDEMAWAVKRGFATRRYHHHNLIVNIGLSVFSRFIGNLGGSPTIGSQGISTLSELTVKSMQIGGALVPYVPPAPAPADTTGVSVLLYQPAVFFGYPDAYSISVNGLLPPLDFVGYTILEEAVMLANGFPLAKITCNFLKSSDLGLQAVHTLALRPTQRVSGANKGAWGSGTAYIATDYVTYAGGIYVAIVANTGQIPSSSPTYWALLAS